MDDTLPGERRVRVGEYSLMEEVGRGGMGVVYRAEDARGRQVALKLLHEDSVGHLSERLIREGEARIDHPNVIQVVDAGRAGETAYIAFEFLEGTTLEEKLEHGQLSVEEVCSLGAAMCAGLDAIHRAGFVHRDIKPGNVFLCDDGGVKILDLGLALNQEAQSSRLTQQGMVLGTPAYLAPEQARGELDIGPSADIWAAGMVLYECLSGTVPFLRETPLASLVAGLLEEVPPLEKVMREAPSGLAQTIERALEKDSTYRWPSALAMGAALRESDLTPCESTEVTPSHRFMAADENRVVAVILAEEVADARALKEISERLGAHYTPLAGQRGLAVFGFETWEGDEIHRAAEAALEAQAAARRLAICVRFGTRAADGISGRVIDEAQQSLKHIDRGIVMDAETGENLSDSHILTTLESGHRELVGAKDLRSSDVGVMTFGRSEELAIMRGELQRVEEERCARVVVLEGPAGIGRSHFLRSLRADLEHEDAIVLSARCESHKSQLSLSTLAAALRSRVQYTSAKLGGPSLQGPAEQQREALERLADDAWGDSGNKDISKAFLAELLSVPVEEKNQSLGAAGADPALMLDNLKLAVLDCLEGFLQRSLVVLLIDDAHLADRHSLEIIRNILRHDAGRLLVVLSSRSDRNLVIRGVRGRKTVMALGALSPEDTAQLASSMMEVELSHEMQEKLAAQTEGNPLFLRQTILSLADTINEGVLPEDLPLPISLEAAAQSRLDHLPRGEKELCKHLAVFATSFDDEEALSLLTTATRDELQGLIDKTIVEPDADDDTSGRYRIESSILANVAARMLADNLRVKVHTRCAQVLAMRDSLPLAQVAEHFEWAGKTERAGEYFARAALQAAARGSSELVLDYAQKAVDLFVPSKLAFDLQMTHGYALRFAGEPERQGQALDAACACAATAGERSLAHVEKARWLDRQADWPAAHESFVFGVEQARLSNQDSTMAFALSWFSQSLAYRGELEEAKRVLGGAANLQVTGEYRALLADSRGQLAAVDGDLEGRLEAFGDAARQYASIGDLRKAAGAEVNLADAYNRLGAYADAVTALRAGLAQCRRVGHSLMEGYALANLGYALSTDEGLAEAGAVLKEAAVVAEAMADTRLGAAVELYRARVAFLASRVGDAMRRANTARQSAGELQIPSIEALALALLSQIAGAAGDRQSALAQAEQANALRETLGSIEEDEAEIDVAYVSALRLVGREGQAREVLHRAMGRVEEQAALLRRENLRQSFRQRVRCHRALADLQHSESTPL